MPITRSRARSFGQYADTYHRVRPPVPLDIVRWMVPVPCPRAVELGAGTGLLTRDLATYAIEVVATDPDRRMLEVLEQHRPSNVTVMSGDAADLAGVRERSASMVAASSAWHWFDVPESVREIARVLDDGGRLSVVWTHRDIRVEWMRVVCELTDLPHEQLPGEFVLPPRSPFGPIDHIEMAWRRAMPVDDVVDLIGTYSGMLHREDTNPAEAARALDQVADIVGTVAVNGFVDVPFRTSAFRTHRRPRAAGAAWAGTQRQTRPSP